MSQELRNAFDLSRMWLNEDPERRAAVQAIHEVVEAGNVALVVVQPAYCHITDACMGRVETLVSAHPSVDAAEAALMAYDDEADPDHEMSYELRFDRAKAPKFSYHVLCHPTQARKTCFEVGCHETAVNERVWNGLDGEWDDQNFYSGSREEARDHYRQLLAAGWRPPA